MNFELRADSVICIYAQSHCSYLKGYGWISNLPRRGKTLLTPPLRAAPAGTARKGGVLSLHIDIRIGDSALMNRQKSIPSRNEKYGRT